jgi:hypothetical protein
VLCIIVKSLYNLSEWDAIEKGVRKGDGEKFILKPGVMKRGEECFSDPLFRTKGGVGVFSDHIVRRRGNESGF